MYLVDEEMIQEARDVAAIEALVDADSTDEEIDRIALLIDAECSVAEIRSYLRFQGATN